MLTSALPLFFETLGRLHVRRRPSSHRAPALLAVRAGFLALVAVSGLAAASADWAAVTSLSIGTRIDVAHGAGDRSKGTIVAVDDQQLSIQTEAGRGTVRREDIQSVGVLRGSRKKRVLISMAIGAAAGAAAMLIGAESGDIDIRRDYVVGAGAAIGAAGGAAVGALSGKSKTVYRAPR